jgi:nucleoside-diphosphate-sugar epimerase
MNRALIGHTGFVGGNVGAQTTFDECFNSKNIEDIEGKSFELAVCCGAPAVKWKANKEPEADRAVLGRLMRCVAKASIEHVVLISTVDVYPKPVEVDETSEIPSEGGEPYGRHRYALERFFGQLFKTTVVRLPGLFGPGLKKNVIFDLLRSNALDEVNAASVFQFYDLTRIWRDVEAVLAAGVDLVNFATEPVSVRELAREAFGIDFEGAGRAAPARYDFRTIHSALFGAQGPYMMSKAQVLGSMRRFVEGEKRKRA